MDDVPKCPLCGSIKVKKSGSVCNSCNRLDLALKAVNNWNLQENSKPKFLCIDFATKVDPDKLRIAAIRVINKDIQSKRALKESMERTDITGIEIEHLIEGLLSNLPYLSFRKIRRIFFQFGNVLDADFSVKQKEGLFKRFQSLAYEIPEKPLKIKIAHEVYEMEKAMVQK